ncbi:MAG: cation:proton antiporter [Pseudomonadota bacterium]
MILTVLSIAMILYVALQLQDKFKIPSPLSLIVLSFVFHAISNNLFLLTGDPEHFAKLVILLLPILLIGDTLELRLADLKEHGLSLFYLAVVAVSLSVVVALFSADYIFAEYQLSAAAIVMLFAMVLATDPVSVVSIFSNFELPHKLKILAEGESLFNDATALIVFVFIGLYGLEGGVITTGYVTEISLVIIFASAAVGVAVGYIGLALMKTTENRISELLLLIMTGYGGFELSEHFYAVLNLFGGHSHMHLSGILGCIFATLTLHHNLTRNIQKEEELIEKEEEEIRQESKSAESSSSVIDSALSILKINIEEKERHMRTKEDIQLLAIVANTILFVAMAEIIDFELLLKYKFEIISMFLVTTVIRAGMMAKFAFITNQTNKMANVNYRWWGVLTFAGIKGGLSVVMLMMIPQGFDHIEMFKAVVVGVILLSTFIYSTILIVIIGKNSETFRKEMLEEGH